MVHMMLSLNSDQKRYMETSKGNVFELLRVLALLFLRFEFLIYSVLSYCITVFNKLKLFFDSYIDNSFVSMLRTLPLLFLQLIPIARKTYYVLDERFLPGDLPAVTQYETLTCNKVTHWVTLRTSGTTNPFHRLTNHQR